MDIFFAIVASLDISGQATSVHSTVLEIQSLITYLPRNSSINWKFIASSIFTTRMEHGKSTIPVAISLGRSVTLHLMNPTAYLPLFVANSVPRNSLHPISLDTQRIALPYPFLATCARKKCHKRNCRFDVSYTFLNFRSMCNKNVQWLKFLVPMDILAALLA